MVRNCMLTKWKLLKILVIKGEFYIASVEARYVAIQQV